VHNTQEIKTIDFDDLDFLSRIIFLKNRFGFFPRVKSTTPRCHSSFYRVLLFVILNSFIITCVVRHFNCTGKSVKGSHGCWMVVVAVTTTLLASRCWLEFRQCVIKFVTCLQLPPSNPSIKLIVMKLCNEKIMRNAFSCKF
jgi:hypothetical protein